MTGYPDNWLSGWRTGCQLDFLDVSLVTLNSWLPILAGWLAVENLKYTLHVLWLLAVMGKVTVIKLLRYITSYFFK